MSMSRKAKNTREEQFVKQIVNENRFKWQTEATANYQQQVQDFYESDSIANSQDEFLNENITNNNNQFLGSVKEKESTDLNRAANYFTSKATTSKPTQSILKNKPTPSKKKVQIEEQQRMLLEQIQKQIHEAKQEKLKTGSEKQERAHFDRDISDYDQEQEQDNDDIEAQRVSSSSKTPSSMSSSVSSKKKTNDYSSRGSSFGSQMSSKSKKSGLEPLLQHITKQKIPLQDEKKRRIRSQDIPMHHQAIQSSLLAVDAMTPKSDADRSRKRTEKQQQYNKYERRPSLKEPSKKRDGAFVLEQSRRRSMKDIQGESLRTSYAVTHKSFKWSSKAKGIIQSKIEKQNEAAMEIEFDENNSVKKKVSIDLLSLSDMEDNDYDDDDDDVEEEGGDIVDDNLAQNIQLQSANYPPSNQVSQRQTVPKGIRNRQLKRTAETKHREKSSEFLAQEAQFYSRLSQLQKSEVFSRVESFGEAMTLFMENCHILIRNVAPDSFELHSSIGEGSFGQVDLYFIKEYYPLQQIQQQSQPQQFSHQQHQQQNVMYSNASTMVNSNASQLASRLNNSLIPVTASSNIFYSDQKTSFQFQQQQQMPENNHQMGPPLLPTLQFHESIEIENNFKKQQSQPEEVVSQLVRVPVAGKHIENLEEFTRELYIMQNVACEYMPRLIHADLSKQLLYMELGLCSLEDLKNDSEASNYSFSDEFTHAVLVTAIKAVEALITNVDKITGKPRPLFHSDIKPSNFMLTVKKYRNQLNSSIKLLLIDYGGASFAIEDYWSFYTPAFVCQTLWAKLVQNSSSSADSQSAAHLTWEEIRYAEIYAVCRTVQYLIADSSEKSLFAKDNFEEFLEKYTFRYPSTCRILATVFRRQRVPVITNVFKEVLSYADTSQYTGISPQNIPLECERIFKISKVFEMFNV